MNSNVLGAAKLIVAALVAVAFGAFDLWRFHALASTTDLIFIIGGFTALGVPINSTPASVAAERLMLAAYGRLPVPPAAAAKAVKDAPPAV